MSGTDFIVMLAGITAAFASIAAGVNIVLAWLLGIAVVILGSGALTAYRALTRTPEERDRRANTFRGVEIRGDRIESVQGAGPLRGAHARVETAGQVTSRVSATRLVALGPLGLLARKKVDNRELYLTIEGDGFFIVQQLDAATDGLSARQFAARINTAPVNSRM